MNPWSHSSQLNLGSSMTAFKFSSLSLIRRSWQYIFSFVYIDNHWIIGQESSGNHVKHNFDYRSIYYSVFMSILTSLSLSIYIYMDINILLFIFVFIYITKLGIFWRVPRTSSLSTKFPLRHRHTCQTCFLTQECFCLDRGTLGFG